MQKIFITGGSGFIGSQLLNLIVKKNKNLQIHAIFNKNIINVKSTNNFHKYKIDLRKKKDLLKNLNKINPHLIINLVGFKNPRKNELNKKKSYEDNFIINKNLTDYCKKNKKKLIYTSTDLVYNHAIKKPTERQASNPNTLHGINKLKSEIYIKRNLKNYLILRFSTVYDEINDKDDNFINASCKKIINKKNVYAATNIYRRFISTQKLTILLVKLIYLKAKGTYNVGGVTSSYFNKIKSICLKRQIKYKKYLFKSKINLNPKYRAINVTKINSLLKK